MLYVLLTYEQVMARFLDFFTPFGRPRKTQDLKFSAFGQDITSLMAPPDRTLEIPELGRTGRTFQICYNLRSAEPSESHHDSRWPWSIRQAAIHHSFDLRSGIVSWIVVKGSTLLRDRIISSCRSKRPAKIQQYGNMAQSFVSSLFTHLLFCDWAEENWSSYVSFLENGMETASKKAINAPITATEDFGSPCEVQQEVSPTFEKGLFSKSSTFVFSRSTTLNSVVVKLKSRISSRPQDQTADPGVVPEGVVEEESNMEDQFPFEDIQRLQFLHESVGSASLCVGTNIKIMAQLVRFYDGIDKYFDHCPSGVKTICLEGIEHFRTRLESLLSNHHTYEVRLESLATALAHRKQLVSTIEQIRKRTLKSSSCKISMRFLTRKPADALPMPWRT